MPKEDQCEPMTEASSSKPRSQKIDQLLRQVYELEVLGKEIKRTNERLTRRNDELYDSLQEIKMKYTNLEESNPRLMKEKTRPYRKIRLSKLQTRNSGPQSQAHQKLETLAEVAMSLCDIVASCDVSPIPKPIQVAETPKGQH